MAMAFNILDAVKGFLTPDMIGKAASYLGESDSTISKAVTGLVPATLAGIINKAESPGGASSIFDLAQKALGSGILGNLGATFSKEGGGIPDFAPGLLSGIFGDKVGHIANAVSQWSGIKGSSVASLLGSIAPLALGLLGKNASENGLNAGGLLSMLTAQKSSILSALPGGLSLGSLFGGSHDTPKVAAAVPHHEVKKSGSWLMPLLLGVAAVALLLYLVKGCGGGHKEETHATETPAAVTDSAAKSEVITPAVGRSLLKLKLADGTEVDATDGGFEFGLVNCLNDANCVAGKDKWFDFDDVNFEVGSAKLTDSSLRQINNIVAILKAYPKAKIKIGGYTDKTGDPAVNKKLSQERADAVAAAIKSAGGNAAQIVGAEGYGSEFAKVAATASDEERKSDRRMAVQLREK